ncbi:hypothetical protein Acr_00g0018790 [Actinidia rufa]|uniref:Uncharacterized protein n=1 Tax=Actinidia rufa TaxID=165716 RepID=A0A7J0DBJ8_9ERIC|nr:hypothetical protein Acr_00g0018790 [Actinidia rufa]
MPHTFSQSPKRWGELERLCQAFNQVVLEVEDPSDKVVIMAMMEGQHPSPLFESLSKNVPKTLSTLQSKADKYIAVEELAKAKCRRRGRDDHKRKEHDSQQAEYRDEVKSKRSDRDARRKTNDRCSCTLPRRLDLMLPPLNAPIARYGDNKPIARDIQTIHGRFGLGGCSSSSQKRRARGTNRRAEEVYNLSAPLHLCLLLIFFHAIIGTVCGKSIPNTAGWFRWCQKVITTVKAVNKANRSSLSCQEHRQIREQVYWPMLRRQP